MGFGVDLMIVEIPKDLHILHLSIPAIVVPNWNKLRPGFLSTIFDFVSSHVHNIRAILFFHAKNLKIKTKLKGFMKAYNFSIFRKWMGINQRQMTSVKDHSKTMSFQFPQCKRNAISILIALFIIKTLFYIYIFLALN